MIRDITPADYPRLAEIWESAVRHTHDFLAEADFRYYKAQLPSYFPYVSLAGYEADGRLHRHGRGQHRNALRGQ